MKIRLIHFGGKDPVRNYDNDSGADVFAADSVSIAPGTVAKIPTGIGLELPNGYDAVVHCKSGLSSKGIWSANAPIDAGYRGEIFAILFNTTNETYEIKKGEKVGQIVIRPVIYADFVNSVNYDRGSNGFGSTGM